jgi:hypothetical protein
MTGEPISSTILDVVRLSWGLVMNSVPLWGGYVLFVKRRPAGPLFIIALVASIQWVILHWK